jgi:hypothetical protein
VSTVNVTNYQANFSAVNTAAPVDASGQFDPTKVGYNAGGPNCVIAVQLYDKWPIYVSLLGFNLSSNTLFGQSGNYRLLVAISVFRNEPYGPAAC